MKTRKRTDARSRFIALVVLTTASSLASAADNGGTASADSVDPPRVQSLSKAEVQKLLLDKFLRLATEPPPSKSDLKAMFGLSFVDPSTSARGSFPIGAGNSYFLPGKRHVSVHITLTDRIDWSNPAVPRPVVATCLPLGEVVQFFDDNGWSRASRSEVLGHTAAKRTLHRRAYDCRDVSVELSPSLILQEGAPASEAGSRCMTSIEFTYKTTCEIPSKN